MQMIKMLPQRLQDTEIGLFQQGAQLIFDDLVAAQEEFVLQLDPTTATWGLGDWEAMLGITTDVSKNEEYRQSAIVAALRGSGTSTLATIQTLAASFENGEVEVIEIPGEYRIEIHFTSTVGTPPNLDDLTAALNAAIPAHLMCEYVIIYRTWAEVAESTWGDLTDQLSWYDIKNGVDT